MKSCWLPRFGRFKVPQISFGGRVACALLYRLAVATGVPRVECLVHHRLHGRCQTTLVIQGQPGMFTGQRIGGCPAPSRTRGGDRVGLDGVQRLVAIDLQNLAEKGVDSTRRVGTNATPLHCRTDATHPAMSGRDLRQRHPPWPRRPLGPDCHTATHLASPTTCVP
jgi:hypothetical protein